MMATQWRPTILMVNLGRHRDCHDGDPAYKGKAQIQILKIFRGRGAAALPRPPLKKARFARLIAKAQVPIFWGRYPKSPNPTVARFEKRIFQSCCDALCSVLPLHSTNQILFALPITSAQKNLAPKKLNDPDIRPVLK